MKYRKTGHWMKYTDERILEYLSEVSTATAWEIAYDQGVEGDRRRIEHRCRVLANAGFVDVYIRDVGLDDEYEITSWGELYLGGDVDAELQRPLPAVRPPDKVRSGWWAGFG
ncbi:winged helix-turn-helix domain-containing protein [Haloplanus pelagicus]|jgi:hypothetical protein|uniref:winged helix-turn-helix domain-containing protein n=1 Tax=Haloplanus pelagicus TaxID=2949995 RepID=UPI00203F5DA2|nr:winged helix-turn-helix domain-containing protein [Haloplanus sp. HW8-1]